MKKLLFISFN